MQVSMSEIKEKIPVSCHYDPLRWAPHDWEGDHLEILEAENIPVQDRIFIVFHLISEDLQRRFARNCAQIYQEHFSVSEPRIIDAVAICEGFLGGIKTEEELSLARASALSLSRETQNQGIFITAKAIARACSLPVILPHFDSSCADSLLEAIVALTEDL